MGKSPSAVFFSTLEALLAVKQLICWITFSSILSQNTEQRKTVDLERLRLKSYFSQRNKKVQKLHQ